MFDTQISGEKDTGTLTLTGDLTFDHCKEIRDALLDVLSRFKTIVLRLENLEQIDLFALQLFYAARKSALKQEKSLSLITPPPDNHQFWKTLQHCGFSSLTDKDSFSPETRGFLIPEVTAS